MGPPTRSLDSSIKQYGRSVEQERVALDRDQRGRDSEQEGAELRSRRRVGTLVRRIWRAMKRVRGAGGEAEGD